VKYYAALMNLSPKYFSKIITEAAGMSPADWIEQYVVAQAKLMLHTQPMTVKETAYRLGFDESASFCRFFKRVAGVTPREFLKLK
jgi:AraC-like DNA-binding protein